MNPDKHTYNIYFIGHVKKVGFAGLFGPNPNSQLKPMAKDYFSARPHIDMGLSTH